MLRPNRRREIFPWCFRTVPAWSTGPETPDRNRPMPAIAPASCRRRSLHPPPRSEEHTSELQSLMRISYAVFCLKKRKTNHLANTTQANILPSYYRKGYHNSHTRVDVESR